MRPDASAAASETAGDWTRPALFHVDRVPEAGAAVTLDGPEGRHAADVRRVRPGEILLLGDGAGTRARAAVRAAHKGAVDLEILQRRHDEPPAPRVTLAQALVKGDRGELAVELAVEAGVDAVLPWRAERCVARWDDGPRGEKALARWRSTAREAAKQARRAWTPEVGAPVSTAQLAARPGVTLVLEATAATTLAEVGLPATGELLVVVGPEGGITADERDALGGTPVRMGPDVVRASTAAVVALGALGARTGRWAPPSSAS